MNLWKYCIICVTIIMVIGTSCIVSATSVNDPTGDVWQKSQSGGNLSWTGGIGNKPEIDITNVSVMINEFNLTLTMVLVGTVQASQNISYWVNCNTTDAFYTIYWSNNMGNGFASLKQGGKSYYINNITVSGNTLGAVFKVLSNASTTDLWGMTTEYTASGINQTESEWWDDWAPNSKAPFSTPPIENPGNNTHGNNTGKKTPGFEVLPVIAAVAVTAILLRRRR